MANQLVTPEWLTREILTAPAPQLFNPSKCTRWDTSVGYWCVPQPQLPPMTTKTLITFTAAAVIASPRKISRRALLALGWKTR